MEMPMYGVAQQTGYGSGVQGGQQSGVVGSGRNNGGDVEQGQTQQLPPRPQQAKAKVMGMLDRFRR